ncbi:MAG: putative toxin-antitoxin system toxin component, PIN family [Elusimicrobia bacterium]|jgi:putative PIN family toxin of toxin-antitoxin system|nr:putative toxin-antitoxin system toxin component, PIN family [Elusimicrobiota bacterium]
MRVVIDTNVVLSGVLWHGTPERVLNLWLGGDLRLLVSLPILEEYREIFGRFIDPRTELFSKWDHLLSNASELVDPLPMAPVCRDPKDQIFLEAAVGGKAQYLVSGDKDLLDLKDVRGIPIVAPAVILRLARH